METKPCKPFSRLEECLVAAVWGDLVLHLEVALVNLDNLILVLRLVVVLVLILILVNLRLVVVLVLILTLVNLRLVVVGEIKDQYLHNNHPNREVSSVEYSVVNLTAIHKVVSVNLDSRLILEAGLILDLVWLAVAECLECPVVVECLAAVEWEDLDLCLECPVVVECLAAVEWVDLDLATLDLVAVDLDLAMVAVDLDLAMAAAANQKIKII